MSTTRVNCSFFRLFAEDIGTRAPWLVCLSIYSDFFAQAWRGMPMARAVMDDFGTLVLVEKFV